MSGGIAILLRSLEGGGMQRNVVELARGFMKRGRRVEVLAVEVEGEMRRQLPAGVVVRRLPTGSRARGGRALLELLPGATGTDRLLLRHGPVPGLFRALPALLDHLRTA